MQQMMEDYLSQQQLQQQNDITHTIDDDDEVDDHTEYEWKRKTLQKSFIIDCVLTCRGKQANQQAKSDLHIIVFLYIIV